MACGDDGRATMAKLLRQNLMESLDSGHSTKGSSYSNDITHSSFSETTSFTATTTNGTTTTSTDSNSGTLLGLWKLHSMHNWDQFLMDIGVGQLKRSLSHSLDTFEDISRKGDDWVLRISNPYKKKVVHFQTNKPLQVSGLGGKKITVVIRVDPDCRTMVAQQARTSPKDKLIHMTWEVLPNDTMRCTYTSQVTNVVACRNYHRVSRTTL